MLQESTITIIKTALDVDTAITKEEKERIIASLEPKHELEKMITTKDVCDLLGITRRTLFIYRQEGKLKPVQYSPRKFRYRYSDICDFMTGRKGE